MVNYQLNIRLATQDVRTINGAGQKVAIVKSVGNTSGTPVIWVGFAPFENNQVSWQNQYGVYASSTQVQSGATIFKTSAVNPASANTFYPFVNGTFNSPNPPGGGDNTYGISNNYSQQFTFGMAQSVTANGNTFDANPLNAVPVLSKQNAVFTPIEIVKVFLFGNFDNGVIISNITSNALIVDLTKDPNPTIKYDQSSGTFVMASALATA
ncbi:hypothetical protein [Nostoc sp.]|uniref:hypothetical protein n=1 Tax=Nostoc sp. TaxID=1180 RepID=UPI002FF4C563